ncbi:MAG: hypothetical protein C0603_00895 [Denitrovibrio sp.]|nr:MAG: hypothetical protein C0603_00895 [Denitrovibrio sp.]
MLKSSNPALNKNVFANIERSTGETMTIQGAANKSLILLVILIFSASYTWQQGLGSEEGLRSIMGWIMPLAIGGLIVAIVTMFKKQWAYITAPIYAVIQGLVLGAISLIMEMKFPGIAMQAVGLTFGTFFMLLIAYKSRLIRATENFKLGVTAATCGIGLLYLVSFVLGMFGVRIPYIHESGLIGIGFSLFVVVIAALNLVMDFDFIESGAEHGAPKYMEWYGAFGLLITLVWLYIEILNLLAKLRGRE